MPTLITHVAVGLAAGACVSSERMSIRFWSLSVICAILPDADVIGFRFGISYGDFLGHRGFFHSLFFALLLSVGVVIAFFSEPKRFSWPWWLLLIYFLAISASHGILDAFTNGGLGIALLSPFDNTRYFFPFTPIDAAPISVRRFFEYGGFGVLIGEACWVWVPLAGMVLLVRRFVRPEFFPRA
jgi:inner membrane protein